MGYTHTDYCETIIQRQIRAGRASNKSEVIHQAPALLDAVTRGQGPVGARFRNADGLEALLLQAGPAAPMTAEHKARICGNVNWRQEPERFFWHGSRRQLITRRSHLESELE